MSAVGPLAVLHAARLVGALAAGPVAALGTGAAGGRGCVARAGEIGAPRFLFFGRSLGRSLADLQGTGLGRRREEEAAADPRVVEAPIGVESVGRVLGEGREEDVAAAWVDRGRRRLGAV